jgi:hypothetical protein
MASHECTDRRGTRDREPPTRHDPRPGRRRAGQSVDRGAAPRPRTGLLQAAVAYYAHHLTKDTAQGAGDPEHLTEPEQEMLLRWAQQLGAPPEVAQGRLAAPARAAADWIARNVGLDSTLVRLLVTTFCREVHLIPHRPTRRHAVGSQVTNTIATHRPAAVIAHSLGSVVTYETLCARTDLQIDLLITLGSPLALPDIVFPHLDPTPTNGKGRRPPGVRRWINIADPGDFIAIPRGLAPYFNGIDTDLTTPIGIFDTHKVTGYLACPTTAAAPSLPPQRTTPHDLPSRATRGQGAAGRLDLLGQQMPYPRLRPARQDHHPLPGPDPQRRRTPAVQRQIRSHQHPPATPDPTRLRLPQPRLTHRHGRPHPKRTLPTTPRTTMNSYPK